MSYDNRHTSALSLHFPFTFPVTTLPLSLGEGRGEDSLSFASKPRF